MTTQKQSNGLLSGRNLLIFAIASIGSMLLLEHLFIPPWACSPGDFGHWEPLEDGTERWHDCTAHSERWSRYCSQDHVNCLPNGYIRRPEHE